jgi:hypothetical protein
VKTESNASARAKGVTINSSQLDFLCLHRISLSGFVEKFREPETHHSHQPCGPLVKSKLKRAPTSYRDSASAMRMTLLMRRERYGTFRFPWHWAIKAQLPAVRFRFDEMGYTSYYLLSETLS